MSNEEQSKKYLLFNIERIIALLSRLENNRPLIKDDCDLLKSMDVNKLLTKENVNVLFTKISEANDLTVNNDLLHAINAKIEKIILNLEYRATDNNKELLALRYDCLSEHHNTAKEALDYVSVGAIADKKRPIVMNPNRHAEFISRRIQECRNESDRKSVV